jgi:predicted  nucleic acid-binding Zn-ribbon protein
MEFTETKDAMEALNDSIEDLEGDIIDLTIEKNKYRDRLEIAADILAESGHITNTPYAKRKWIEGE